MKKLKSFLIINNIIFLFLGIFICSKISYSQSDRLYLENFVDKRFVSVSNFNNGVVLTPKNRNGLIGYIIYPKNNKDINSYIPRMSKLSERGFNVYIIKNPIYMSFDKNKVVSKIMNLDNSIQKWIVTGELDGEVYAKKFYNKCKDNGILNISFYKYDKLNEILKEL